MKTTHHKIGPNLVILAQEWEVEAQYDGYRNSEVLTQKNCPGLLPRWLFPVSLSHKCSVKIKMQLILQLETNA